MAAIGLQLYSLRQRSAGDFFGVLKDVAAMGYAAVETAGLAGKKPREVRKVCDDLGLRVCSAHTTPPTRENLNEIVDAARELGYRYVISGFGPDEFKSMDKILAGARRFQEAAELLRPFGLRMGYHNHFWELDLIEGRYGYNWFFEACPDVFSELDVYWACNFGKVDVTDLLRGHRENTPLLHVKDGPLVQGQPHVAVGQGKMNIPAVVKAGEPTTEFLVVELDECATDMTTAVRESYRYLASISGR